MATATGFTAERMYQIEASSIVDGEIRGDNLILTARDGQTIDAGPVKGAKGDPGDKGDPGAGNVDTVNGKTGPNVLLLPKDIGVGVPKVLSSVGSNLNDCIETGWWHQNTNAGAASGSNYPTGAAGLLEVINYLTSASGTLYQRYTTFDGSALYIRTRRGTTWNAWREASLSNPWLKLSLNGAWTDYSGGGGYRNGLWVRKNGSNLEISIMIGGGSGNIAELPENLRPAKATQFAIPTNTGVGRVSVSPLGPISYAGGPATPAFMSALGVVPLD